MPYLPCQISLVNIIILMKMPTLCHGDVATRPYWGTSHVWMTTTPAHGHCQRPHLAMPTISSNHSWMPSNQAIPLAMPSPALYASLAVHQPSHHAATTKTIHGRHTLDSRHCGTNCNVLIVGVNPNYHARHIQDFHHSYLGYLPRYISRSVTLRSKNLLAQTILCMQIA